MEDKRGKKNSQILESYTYRTDNLRASKEEDGAKTFFIYDGANCIEELAEDGACKDQYIYGPGVDNLLVWKKIDESIETLYYYLTDHLGSVEALVDDSGTIIERYRTDVYGDNLMVWHSGDPLGTYTSLSTEGNQFFFQGRRFDSNTGLYYFRNRYYDSEQGRFISRDPLGMWGDSGNLGNGYTFCGNNPVNRRDPFGFSSYSFSYPVSSGKYGGGHVTVINNDDKTTITVYDANGKVVDKIERDGKDKGDKNDKSSGN